MRGHTLLQRRDLIRNVQQCVKDLEVRDHTLLQRRDLCVADAMSLQTWHLDRLGQLGEVE